MKKAAKVLPILLAALLAMPLAASEEVIGKWQATVETRRGNSEITLEFAASDQGLEGTFTGRDGVEPLKNVVYSDGVLKFQRTTESQGFAATLDYNAKVQGDTMEVTVSTPRGERSFAAQRVN